MVFLEPNNIIVKYLLQTKFAKTLLASSLVFMLVFAPVVAVTTFSNEVFAQGLEIPECPEGAGVNCGIEDVNSLFETIVNWAVGLAFVAAVIYLIYGGFLYILSAGNEEKAKQGRTTIFNALIGIVIIVFSYLAVQIVYQLVSGTGGGIFGT